ncbi:MAG TPA: hypothetical protein VMT20_12345 [Terriglobia bacterium]|nr:hypothetical protein [Terriglobia bacterium]
MVTAQSGAEGSGRRSPSLQKLDGGAAPVASTSQSSPAEALVRAPWRTAFQAELRLP